MLVFELLPLFCQHLLHLLPLSVLQYSCVPVDIGLVAQIFRVFCFDLLLLRASECADVEFGFTNYAAVAELES